MVHPASQLQEKTPWNAELTEAERVAHSAEPVVLGDQQSVSPAFEEGGGAAASAVYSNVVSIDSVRASKRNAALLKQAFCLIGFPSYFTKALGRLLMIGCGVSLQQAGHFFLVNLLLIAPSIALLASVIVFFFCRYRRESLAAAGITAFKTLIKFFTVYLFWVSASLFASMHGLFDNAQEILAYSIVGVGTALGLLFANLVTETLPRYLDNGMVFLSGFLQLTVGALFEGFVWIFMEHMNLYTKVPGFWGRAVDVVSVSIATSTAFIIGCFLVYAFNKVFLSR